VPEGGGTGVAGDENDGREPTRAPVEICGEDAGGAGSGNSPPFKAVCATRSSTERTFVASSKASSGNSSASL
jgi:hypothetical protein